MTRRPKRPRMPANLLDDRGARYFILVMALIVIAIAAVTYWPS